MDIDVRNTLHKLKAVCETGADHAESLEDALASDIYSFISAISLVDADDRFNYFSKLYLNGDYTAEDFRDRQGKSSVEDLNLLKDDYSASLRNRAKALAAFFTALGRSYISSPYDRKYIDQARFIDFVKETSSKAGGNEEHKQGSEDSMQSIAKDMLSEEQDETEPSEDAEPANEPVESLEELMTQLDSLIGLQEVKNEVSQIVNMIKVRKKGEEFGVKQPPLSLHLVFYGNPGTGKTTVARLLAKIYKSLGVLSQGQLVEVDRGGLVAGYVGQTAIKTQETIDKAMGGILFIDEAYALTHGKGDTDFGQEAVDTILKAMEDHRDEFIVIVAGYPDLMKEFISSNPGLKSRFNQYINFADYTPEELYEIFCLYVRNQELILSDNCGEYLHNYFENIYCNRKEDFANGRDVRNYFENVIKARANRLADAGMENMTREEYLTIVSEDLETAAKSTKDIYS